MKITQSYFGSLKFQLNFYAFKIINKLHDTTIYIENKALESRWIIVIF